MKNTQNRAVWSVIIIIIVFAAIALVYKYGVSTSGTDGGSNTSSNTTVFNSREEQLVKYENKEFGYEVSFPGTMGAAKSPISLIIQPSYPAASTTISDATIEVTSVYGKCPTSIGMTILSTVKEKIRGTEFTIVKGSEGAAGSYTELTTYRAERNNICYQASFTINSKRSDNPVITADTKKVIADLGVQFAAIMKTFVIKDAATPSTAPYITSVTPTSGRAGVTVTLSGYNLAGENDVVVWIINSQEEVGYLGAFGKTSDATKIAVKIPAQVCTTQVATGQTCPKFLTVTPGAYSLFAKTATKSSNIVPFTVAK